jgi:hypothetical protein
MPAGKRLARARDDRYSHPQSLAGRQTAIVRERIERHIDAVVLRQQCRVGRPTETLDAVGIDPVAGKLLQDAVGGGRVAHSPVLQHQPGLRNPMQKLGPESHDPLIELRRIVETAEGYKALFQGWQR